MTSKVEPTFLGSRHLTNGLLICVIAVLLSILVLLSDMQRKMGEVLTNAAECGDIDCDDGYDYVSSRETLVRRLQDINELDGEV